MQKSFIATYGTPKCSSLLTSHKWFKDADPFLKFPNVASRPDPDVEMAYIPSNYILLART